MAVHAFVYGCVCVCMCASSLHVCVVRGPIYVLLVFTCLYNCMLYNVHTVQ